MGSRRLDLGSEPQLEGLSTQAKHGTYATHIAAHVQHTGSACLQQETPASRWYHNSNIFPFEKEKCDPLTFAA